MEVAMRDDDSWLYLETARARNTRFLRKGARIQADAMRPRASDVTDARFVPVRWRGLGAGPSRTQEWEFVASALLWR